MNIYSGVSSRTREPERLLCYRVLYTVDPEPIWSTVQLYKGYVKPKLSYTYFWVLERYASIVLLGHPELVRYTSEDYYA